ncbi:MAG: MFS transporter, partial [Chloroflexota bacterium]
MSKRQPVFYGWVLVATAFTSLAFAYGVWNSFPVFFVAILNDFGWSRSSTVLATSIFAGVYALSSPVTGWAIDRFGPRRVMPAGGLMLGLGLLATSRITELWQLYLTYGVLAAVGESMVGTIANMAVLAKWFSHRRGTATGLAAAGIGVGAFFLVPVVQWIINNYGWRNAYAALAVLIVATIPALTLAFQRARPEEMGLLPDGETPKAVRAAGIRPRAQLRVLDERWASTTWTVRQAMGRRRFWL